MPPKTKRPLKEGSGNQAPAAKKRATGKGKGKDVSNDDTPAEAPASSSAGDAQVANSEPTADNGLRKPRIIRGPNGQEPLPTLFPARFQKALEEWKVVLPKSLLGELDGTPDVCFTIGSRVWWETHKKWLAANGKALGMTDRDHEKRDWVLQEPYEPVKEGKGTLDNDFVCIPPPYSEVIYRREEEEEEEEEDEEEEGNEENEGEGAAKPKAPLVHELASRRPDWVWISTMLGHERYKWWVQETRRRDPEEFDYDEYSHARHYGCMEVMENLIRAFNKAMNAHKKKQSTMAVWSEIEGMIMYIDSDDCEFMHSDDGEKVEVMVLFVGTMIVAAVQILVREEKFGPDSEVKNLGLMLAVACRWASSMIDMADFYKETSWAPYLRELAAKHGVEITGPAGMEDVMTRLDKAAAKRDSSDKKRWEGLKWDKEFKMMKDHMMPIGEHILDNKIWSDHYDKTRMSAKELKKAQEEEEGGDAVLDAILRGESPPSIQLSDDSSDSE